MTAVYREISGVSSLSRIFDGTSIGGGVCCIAIVGAGEIGAIFPIASQSFMLAAVEDGGSIQAWWTKQTFSDFIILIGTHLVVRIGSIHR